MSEKEISQYLSFILRHKPEEINLELNSEGWGNISELIEKSQPINKTKLTLKIIQTIVKNSDKKRFQISDDGLNIRARQGHSTTTVNINHKKLVPPSYLYHGTAQRFINSIKEKGLVSKDRQYVHLTENKDTALSVGIRYGKPEILTINALKMHQSGFEFCQAENGVWLVKYVPTEFIIFSY
ncbi:MAG: RNA 2'-phosphotransferase [Acinetobacter sp.]